jgi:hypothetical protein
MLDTPRYVSACISHINLSSRSDLASARIGQSPSASLNSNTKRFRERSELSRSRAESSQEEERLLDLNHTESIQRLLSILPAGDRLQVLAETFLQEFSWISYVIDAKELYRRVAKVDQVRSQNTFQMDEMESAIFHSHLIVLIALCGA